MCGRARCTLNPQQVAAACGIRSITGGAAAVPTVDLDRYRPSYNVSPGANLLVVALQAVGEGRSPVIHCMKWGLVPGFTKKTETPDHFRMFNARSESVKEKASFRRLITQNRCLVAVEGFYEWKKDGPKKQPYYIHFKDDRPLVFAALYDSWENLEGDLLYTFTILTTRCSSALEWLHDRMPVILGSKTSIDIWLDDSTSKLETVLGPYEDADLVWYPVAPAIGKTTFDGPECIKEIQLKPAAENPISKFFTKKVDDKRNPNAEHKNSPEGYLQTDVKEESSAKGGQELHMVEKPENSHDSPTIKSEPANINVLSIKREFEEIATDSRLTSEKTQKLPSGPLKKKGRGPKNSGDKQTTLLSYFGKN